MREETRAGVAAHLGVSADEIALVRNTSEANNTINNGLALQPGDEIVLWDQNHPTNNVAWDVRAARFGFEVKKVSTSGCQESTEQLVEAFSEAISNRTKVLAITHLSNTTGVRLPVRQLCRAAHEKGVYVHVDGAQTWGALNVNLRELGCDSYGASAHKWLVGPKEVGILFIKANRVREVWPNVVAPGWGDDEEPDVIGARKFESLGQRDDAALAAVDTAVDFHQMIGTENVEKRVVKLAEYLKQGLIDLGLELVTPKPTELSGGVCIVKVPGENKAELIDRLYLEHGLAVAPTGGLRICPHIYNTLSHIDRALAAVKVLRSLLV
jgi:selenocysteine lyase/cysteine desulfurase